MTSARRGRRPRTAARRADAGRSAGGRRERRLTAIGADAVARLDVTLGPVPTIAPTVGGEAVALMPLAQLGEGERRKAERMLRKL